MSTNVISSVRDPGNYEKEIPTNGTSLNEIGVFPDNGNWVKATFIVKLQEDFDNYLDILKYSLSDEVFGTSDNPSAKLGDVYQDLINSAGTDNSDHEAAIPASITKGKFRDTSLGGNDAINCLYQFNHDDDIIHPYTSLLNTSGEKGMGRVYSEMIDDNQQIMYLSFGVPSFSGIVDFYKDSIDGTLAGLMTSGDFFTIENIGRTVGAAAGAIITLPFLPIIMLKKLGDIIPDLSKQTVTKYYDLQTTMPLYYRCVNTMLSHLAVNMGLAENGGVSSSQTGSTTSDSSSQENMADAAQETGTETVFGDRGFDIYRIMTKKYKYNKLADDTYADMTLDQMIDHYRSNGESDYNAEDILSKWDQFLMSFSAGVRDALTYVGFRIEKSVDSSESMSNSTGESDLMATLKGSADSTMEKRFSLAAGNTGISAIDGFISGVSGILKGGMQAVGLDSIHGIMMGSGRLDIPDVWKDSNFNKSYSFNMSLRAPYGDPISIMQSIYVPLSMILAGALPRAIGKNAYTSPFLVSAYSKGMFSIPLGIIDSLTIKRGSEEHGWNYQNLPTCVDVSFTIKDLSPTMYLAIMDDIQWSNIFGQNSSFQSYLQVLSGIGLAENLLWSKNMKKRFKIIKNVMKNQRLNPIAYGMSASFTKLGRMYSACIPQTDLGKYQR